MKTSANKAETINVGEAISRSEAFILKYKVAITSVIAAIVILIGGGMLYSTYVTEPKAAEAAESIFEAQNYFNNQLFEKALTGDEKGNLGFTQIIDQYGGTSTANLAKAYAGLSLAQLGRYEEAIPYLKGFDGEDAMISPAVLGALGNCYAQTNDLSSALKYFTKAAKEADNNTVSPYYLMQAGFIYEQQGKKADALKAYTEVKEKYFNSLQAMDIDKYIERVK